MKTVLLNVILSLSMLIMIGTKAAEFSNTKYLKKKHPIYSKIIKLNPSINKIYAMHLSNLIHKYAKQYKQDPFISVAIAKQESNFRNSNRKQQIVVYENDRYKIYTGYTDICVYQIHINTALNYNIDLVRLNANLDYCVEQHFKLLKNKRNMCKHLAKNDWTCYHSTTEVNRLHYKKLVERYL